MALTFDKIKDLTSTNGIIGTDLNGSSRVRDNFIIGKDLVVSGTSRINGNMSINGSLSGTSVLNDDTMSTASSTTMATSSSIKTYIDNITGVVPPSETIVVDDFSGVFSINGADRGTLTLHEGGTYVFDISSTNLSGHALRFSLTEDGTHGGGTPYDVGVSSSGSDYSSGYASSVESVGTEGSNIRFIVPYGLYASADSGTIYYYCEHHSNIGGSITIVSASLGGTIKNYVDNITVSDISDINITDIADNEVLAYDSSTSKWINQTSAEAGLDLSLYLPLAGGTMTGALDMDDNDLQNVKRLSFEDGSFAVAMAKDEDDMASDSATSVASQQSIKAYVDAQTHAAALTQEQVEDYAGALVATGGTKTGITVTYQDGTGDMDFVVDDTGKLPLGGGTMIGAIVFPVTTSTPTSTPANGTMVISDVTSRGSHTYRINFYLNGGWRYEVLT